MTTLNLTNLFRAKMAKEKLGQESAVLPTYNTGFDVLDYRNGSSEDNVIRTGVDGGKIVYIVGRSGTGKTSVAIQSACNISDQSEHSQIIHFDTERATSRARVRNITGWSKEKFDAKYIHLEEDVTSESFFKTIKAIGAIKKENYDLLKIDTGLKDQLNQPIYTLPPTVAILDSLALLAPEKIDNEEELSGQMSATAIARANASVFKRIMNILRSANIILFVVNHINTKIDINPMAKTQAQVNYLKQDETLPGGNTPIYLANTMFKLVASSKLEEDKEFGIKGFILNIELIKSRSAASGNIKSQLVFDQANGFNNTLSNYLLLKDCKKIGGAGRGYYLETLPDIKFSQKTILEKYNTIPEFKEHFDALVQECLMQYIPESSTDKMMNEVSDTMTLDDETGYYTDGLNFFELNQETNEYEPVEL